MIPSPGFSSTEIPPSEQESTSRPCSHTTKINWIPSQIWLPT